MSLAADTAALVDRMLADLRRSLTTDCLLAGLDPDEIDDAIDAIDYRAIRLQARRAADAIVRHLAGRADVGNP